MSDKPTVFEALSAVMADVQAVKKGDRNTQQNYSFRGIDSVINAVGPVLRKHGVIAVPHATEAHYRDVQTSNGKPSRECTVKVTYRFYGPAGDHLDVEVPGESMDFGDKGAPKAMSVAYRIALLQALCIPTDDVEPDAQSYARDQPTQQVQRHGPPADPATVDDPWATPPPGRVTDLIWLEDFRRRITAATKPSELRGLQEEANVQWADRKLSREDAAALKAEVAQRDAELKGEVATV